MDNEKDTIWEDNEDIAAAAMERRRLASLRPNLLLRAKAIAQTRDFFAKKDFLEIQTPVRIPTPALEDYIDAIPSGDAWLRTSPEFHLKRMLAAGYDKIFQIGPCFRKDECGKRHLLEFTMLEWYRAGGNWMDVLKDTEELLKSVALATLNSTKCHFRGHVLDLGTTWDTITVEKAFADFAGEDLDKCIEEGRFEQVLVSKVEPCLGINGRPTALTEYPLACSGLSRQIPGRPNRVERWEFYIAGLELGNACSELAEPAEQTRRFKECAFLRHRENRIVYKLDQPFLDAIRLGMPPAAGVAIGMDRLFMMLLDLDTIADASAFA